MKSRRTRWAGDVARMVEVRMYTTFWPVKLKGRDYADNLGVDGKVTLEWILRKLGDKAWNG
jgi:hypothetical protein